jgi:transcriptional regulator with XRE-family HTH domain
MLAGVSVDYLVRLEQGRAEHPSPGVLAALARALRLDDEERDHLYRLGGIAPPARATVSVHIPAGVQRVVDRLADSPVSVFTAAWDPVAWNPLWSALLGDPTELAPRDRNVARRHFLLGTDVVTYAPQYEEAFSVALAGDLRAALTRYPEDPRLAELVRDLTASSPRFAALWAAAPVGEHTSSRKTIRTAIGPIELDCDVLLVPGSDLRVVVYTAEPGSADAEKLAFLAVTGLRAASGSSEQVRSDG